MKIKDIALSAAYVGQSVVKAICVGAQEVWSAVKYLIFKDKAVEQICATNWGDGTGITEEQAASVTDIGTVFQGNTEITSFDELEKFSRITKLGHYGSAGRAAFSNCSSLRSVIIPNSVTDICANNFMNCTSLVSVGDLHNVRKIEGYSFENCTSLRSVGSLVNAEEINARAFNGCVGLLIDELDMPNCNKIEGRAFTNTKIKRIKNIGAVTSLSTFTNLFGVSVEYANLPATLSELGDNVFNGCSSLKVVLMNAATPPTLGTSVFAGTPSYMTIYVPDQSVSAYREASGWSAYADRIKPLSQYVES